MRATLPQVADRAGVSLSSASRALNGVGASEAMIKRVRQAAEELGYTPDLVGRSLRTRRTLQIAFAVADIGNPVYVEMMTAIQSVVGPQGYRLVVAPTGDSIASTVELVRSLHRGFVDGMIISPLRVNQDVVRELQQAPVPVVVIGRSLEKDHLDSVRTDSAAGIGMAIDHVVELGRRHIGFINGPQDTTPGASRQRGFEEAVARDGFTAETVDFEVAEDFTVTAGIGAAGRLLTRHRGRDQLDAIVAANDLLAIGAIKAAREHGLRVPEDVAVTGMDDTQLASVFQPSLTSVSLGSGKRGQVAAEMLLGLLEDRDSQGRSVFVEPRLVIRESTHGPQGAKG